MKHEILLKPTSSHLIRAQNLFNGRKNYNINLGNIILYMHMLKINKMAIMGVAKTIDLIDSILPILNNIDLIIQILRYIQRIYDNINLIVQILRCIQWIYNNIGLIVQILESAPEVSIVKFILPFIIDHTIIALHRDVLNYIVAYCVDRTKHQTVDTSCNDHKKHYNLRINAAKQSTQTFAIFSPRHGIKDSLNIASVCDEGVGLYTFNFSTSANDNEYFVDIYADYSLQWKMLNKTISGFTICLDASRTTEPDQFKVAVY